MRVGPRGGQADVLATEADGVPFNYLNGVDVDQDTGDVYFTDSSTTITRRYVYTDREQSKFTFIFALCMQCVVIDHQH